MQVRTDQGTIINVDNSPGIVPTKGTAAAATAGFGVPANTTGAINTNTSTPSSTETSTTPTDAAPSAGFSLKEILATLKPPIDPDKALADWDKFDTASIKGVKVSHGVNIDDTVSPSKRYNKSQHDLILSLATPGALHGIGGMPASYLDNTDPPSRDHSNGLGYFYMQQNIVYGQFIAFKPGWIRWNISGDDAQSIANGGSAVAVIGGVLSGSIYQNAPLMDSYWRDVSRACRLCIFLMGLQSSAVEYVISGGIKASSKSKTQGKTASQTMVGIQLGNANRNVWRNIGLGLANVIVNKTSTAQTEESNKEDSGFVAFYVDGNIEAGDALSNATSTSEFKNALDSMAGSATGMVKEVASKMFGAGTTDNNMLDFMVGNPLIPDVWSDSTFDKSYTVPMKFVSAAGDPLSIFMNVMFPLIKLLMIALPSGTGGFIMSPPVLRVFSQSAINTDYAIVTGLSIQKNMNSLNDYGQPTEISISVSVTDLLPRLFRDKPGWILHSVNLSSSFSNFMATLCGGNVTTITASAKANMAIQIGRLEGREAGAFFTRDVSQKFSDAINNIAMPFRNAKNKALVQLAYSSNVVVGVFAGDTSSGAIRKGTN